MTDVIAPTLGNLIRLARTDANLTQTELAKAIPTNQSTVSAWESGKQRPKITQVGALADALGIEREALLAAVEADVAAS